MRERWNNLVIALMGIPVSIILGTHIFTAETIDWSAVYMLGLLVVSLGIHVKHNIIGSN